MHVSRCSTGAMSNSLCAHCEGTGVGKPIKNGEHSKSSKSSERKEMKSLGGSSSASLSTAPDLLGITNLEGSCSSSSGSDHPRLAHSDNYPRQCRIECNFQDAKDISNTVAGGNPFFDSFKIYGSQVVWSAKGECDGGDVKQLVAKINKFFTRKSSKESSGDDSKSLFSIHINTGTHGTTSGDTVASVDKVDKNLPEIKFAKHDLKTVKSLKNVSIHIITSTSPPQYPTDAAHIIDAWCFSGVNQYLKKLQFGQWHTEDEKFRLIITAASTPTKTKSTPIECLPPIILNEELKLPRRKSTSSQAQKISNNPESPRKDGERESVSIEKRDPSPNKSTTATSTSPKRKKSHTQEDSNKANTLTPLASPMIFKDVKWENVTTLSASCDTTSNKDQSVKFRLALSGILLILEFYNSLGICYGAIQYGCLEKVFAKGNYSSKSNK